MPKPITCFLSVIGALFFADVAGAMEPSSMKDVLSVVEQISRAKQVDMDLINKGFCVGLGRAVSGRLGYTAYDGEHVGCGLPITYIQLDMPSVQPQGLPRLDTYIRIRLDNKSCLSRNEFERRFPGGATIFATDTAAPVYSANIGEDMVGAEYETLTSRYGCVSEISLRIKRPKLSASVQHP
jgi:hypothetical protein